MNQAQQLEQARDYYTRGIPSLLPDTNKYRHAAESHRWGQHYQGCPSVECPGLVTA